MIIAHVLSSFALGGQERVALDLAREQERRGHEVLAVSLAAEPEGVLGERFRRASVRTHTIPKRSGVDPILPFVLGKWLARQRVEVVHTHNPQALVYGAPAGKLARAAVLHTKHGINPDPRRRRWLRRVAASLADAYVAVTPSLAEVARRAHECDPERLHVVANGIALANFAASSESRREVRSELGIPLDAWVVGTVGRLAPEKNQALLIRALAGELGPRQRLILVGDGAERSSLETLSRDLHLEGFVRFTGARDDVARLLSAFDVFALSSRSEGLPLVLLEAQACALPVVSTRVGGIPDLVDDGQTGLLTAPGNEAAFGAALRTLRLDPLQCERLGRAGHDRVIARHSAERMATQYLVLYQRLVDEKRLARIGAVAGAPSR